MEERHYKVRKGRELHSAKEKTNIGYLRKRYNVSDKVVEAYLSSPNLGVRGVVDEVLFFEDGTAGPLDYKFAKYRGRVFRTHRYQSALYGLMIADSFDISVRRGYVVYTRSKNKIVQLEFTDRDKIQVSKIIGNIFNIIQAGEYPDTHTNKRKCLNCTYRRICTQ
jgi:CRISPR-associated exonuclease Cas4